MTKYENKVASLLPQYRKLQDLIYPPEVQNENAYQEMLLIGLKNAVKFLINENIRQDIQS